MGRRNRQDRFLEMLKYRFNKLKSRLSKLKADSRNIAVVAFSYQFTDIHKTVFCYKL